jgi:hypothetical protein
MIPLAEGVRVHALVRSVTWDVAQEIRHHERRECSNWRRTGQCPYLTFTASFSNHGMLCATGQFVLSLIIEHFAADRADRERKPPKL